mgnify:CR=1 FL=1
MDVDLNGLSAGDYYVIATVTLDNSYGNVVSEPAKIPFKVSPVENKWVVSTRHAGIQPFVFCYGRFGLHAVVRMHGARHGHPQTKTCKLEMGKLR